MSIKFINKYDKGAHDETFGQVCAEQFFINMSGDLCQKTNSDSYCTIADENGVPLSWPKNGISSDTKVRRILDEVIKIEF